MGQVSRILRQTTDGYIFFCPGCHSTHQVWTEHLNPEANWSFNNNLEKPTFVPSILVRGSQIEVDENDRWTGRWLRNPDGSVKQLVCHTFVTDGRIQFLPDCTHELAGQTVDIPVLPQHLED
jgi:nitrate reductase beta subunit